METEDLDFDIRELYTPIDVAKKEVQKRWADKKLRKKVEAYLGAEMPAVFGDKPRSSIFRFVKTPNLEFQIAQDMGRTVGLDLVFMEFWNDKFCTRNQDKLHLAKLVFYHEKNGQEPHIEHRHNIIDVEKNDGVPFKNIITNCGKSFIDYHHDLFEKKHGDTDTFDVSFFKKNGESAYEVYLKTFTLFICHGIYFENYFIDSDKEERKFVFEVIIPAFKRISEEFGIKPLIVPLVSDRIDGCKYWQYYPSDLIEYIDK